MSGGIKSTSTEGSPSLEPASAPVVAVSEQPQPMQVAAVTWKVQTLNIGPVRIRTDLPSMDEAPTCLAPGPTDDEVGVCQSASGGSGKSVWQIRVVTQRDRFVPIRWFDDAIQSLRRSAPDVLTRQLGNEANLVTKAGFVNAMLLSAIQLPGALAVRGTANGLTGLPASASQSCVYAFLLSQNRPTTVLYCATDDQTSLKGTQKLVASLQKYNASAQYKRGSARGAEHAFYLKRLKAAGGAAAAPDLVASEQAFEQSAAGECEKYPALSQERYQCHEGFASARIDALSRQSG